MKSRTRMFGTAFVVFIVFVAVVGSASAAQSPPSISSAFTPNSIGAGNTTALSFTITNPNSSVSLSGIAFTDTLPAGLVVDNPNGQNGRCGSTSTLTANPGSSTISLTAGKLAAGATCTVSAAVTSSTPGIVQNSTGAVSSTEGGAGNSDTESLTMIAPPTVSVAAPVEGQVFAFDQTVRAHYGCREAVNGPGLTDCSGDAANGAPIDTSVAGPNTFTVTAVSDDGEVVTQSVDYTVRPDNRFTVSHIKAHSGGSLRFDVKLPGAGRLVVLESAPNGVKAAAGPTLTARSGRFAIARVNVKKGQAGTFHFTLSPSASVEKLLKKHKSKIFVRLAVLFTPTGGLGRSTTYPGIQITP